MDRTLSKRCVLLGAAVLLLGCGLAWADEPPAPRPDAIADDEPRFQVLELARKHSLPGPIEIPRPITGVKPVGGDAGYFGGGSGWNGSSAVPLGGGAAAGSTANQRIEASLKKAVAQLR